MKRDLQSRESDFIQNPDTGFIRDCIKELDKEGRCFAYKMWQVEEIQKFYGKKTKYELRDWYYVVKICN